MHLFFLKLYFSSRDENHGCDDSETASTSRTSAPTKKSAFDQMSWDDISSARKPTRLYRLEKVTDGVEFTGIGRHAEDKKKKGNFQSRLKVSVVRESAIICRDYHHISEIIIILTCLSCSRIWIPLLSCEECCSKDFTIIRCLEKKLLCVTC